MPHIPGRIILNAARAGAAPVKDGRAVVIPSEDPLIELALAADGAGDAAPKVERQARQLRQLAPRAQPDDPFGPALDWSHRCYKVLQPSGGDLLREYLYLFNVLVALEWRPSQAELDQLKQAFRRASDFLFDVTDGWMAFGQVVFGGPALMDAADIQIAASTRLHPRSWVGGMHAHAAYQRDEKYTPIRIGRGLWNANRRGVIPWDEPEGYRIIVHEWGHHALRLTDEYLELRQQLLPAAARELGAAEPTPATIVTLKVPTTSDSIMATTEGTSELVSDQWPRLHELFARLPASRPPGQVRAGPGRLPAALPHFRALEIPSADLRPAIPAWDGARPSLLPADCAPDRCWAYVLQGPAGASPHPARVIAQGTLEARSAVAPFALLGAAPGDTAVLIAERRGQPPAVLCAALAPGRAPVWRAAAPPAYPAIEVIPEPVAPNEPRARLRVRLSYAAPPAPDQLPEYVGVFPLGGAPGVRASQPGAPADASWVSEPLDVPTLDGHVLLRWRDGGLLLSTFSQGGDGPNSQSPYPANPLNAGSADGEALLLMHKDGSADRAPNDVKVVTTVAHGLAGAPAGGRERSYAFCVASNRELPVGLHPTLLMYYDQPDDDASAPDDGGDLAICRRGDDGAWVPLPTYLPPRFRFAVAPLDEHSARALTDPAAPAPRVAHFKVCWVPRV